MASRSGRARNLETGEFVAAVEEAAHSPLGPPTGDVFCAADWRESLEKDHGAPPAEIEMMAALDLGTTAWEDNATLQWPVFLEHKQVVPGRVSVEIDALTHDPRPFAAQLLVVIPLHLFDPGEGADIAVARGVQWWTPGTAPKVKLMNRTTHTKSIDAGVQIATSYATNCDNVERMLLIKEPVPPEAELEPPPLESPTSEPGIVEPDEGIRRFDPVPADIINSQVDKMLEQKIIDYSDSQWCARISPQKKKDGTIRLAMGYRPLNALTKKNSRGIGTLQTMHHRVRKSKWFTLLDLPQAYHQIAIKASDRPKTAFRDARGRLYHFNRCSFGLTTIPAVFSALLGNTLRPVESGGCVERWLDDILIHTESLEEHFKVLEEVLDLLQKAGYTVHFRKSLFCRAEVEFPGVMVGRSGVRPPLSKIKPLTEMESPATVGELRSFVGMANFLRDFVKDFSAIIAPITDILRNMNFQHQASEEQTHPVGTGTGGSPRCHHQRFGVTAALYGLDHFRTYLLHRPFTLVTDCSAITWLFTSQHLSSTMYREPSTPSRMPSPAAKDRAHEPLGPVLDGIPLQSLAPPDDAEKHVPEPRRATGESGNSPGGAPALDGVRLAALGATEVATGPELPLHVAWALQHALEPPDPTDHARLAAYEEVRQAFTPRRPRTVVLGCGAGGALLALGETLTIDTAIDPEWTALECARTNAWSYNTNLVRTPLASPKCREVVADAKPEIFIGDACRRYDPDRTGNTAVRQASDTVDVFVSCRATLLILECPVRFAGTAEWREILRPRLELGQCSVEEATMSATDVGVPTRKQRVFIVAYKRQPGDTSAGLSAKLAKWKQRLQQPAPVTPTVGAFLERGGHYFLRRQRGEKAIFDVHAPSLTLTHSHIIGRRPPLTEYKAHPEDAGPLNTPEDLQWSDFVKLTTAQGDFQIPPTVRRTDAAWALEEFTLPPMLREASSTLEVYGIAPTTMDPRNSLADDLLFSPHDVFADTTEAAADTALQEPRFAVTPAVTRRTTRRGQPPPRPPAPPPWREPGPAGTQGRRQQGSRKGKGPARTPTSPAGPEPPEEDDPKSPVPAPAPPPSPMELDTGGSPTPPPPSPPPAHTEERPATPESHGRGDDLLDTPELRRGLSANLERMENILRDPTQLAETQRRDPILGPIRATLEAGQGDGTDYVMADNHLLWHAPRGQGRPRFRVVLPGPPEETCLEYATLHDARPPSSTMEVLHMDIQDMKVTSEKGNRYLLVVVDRASKFLTAFPLPSKDALGVSSKLLELLLIFGMPFSVRADMGSENIARVMKHLCNWLKEALSLLCKAWPQRWDDYVPVATWIHWVTPDLSLPGGASPYQILFGLPPRSHIDLLAQPLDGASFGQGLEITVEEQHHMTQEILAKRQEALTKQSERHNAKIGRESPGAKAQVGDFVLVRETPVSLYRDSLHPKLAHEHFTGPWKVVNVLPERLCFTVQMNGRRVRQRRVVAADVKPFHQRPAHLQLEYEDEFSHLIWSADLGLAGTSVAAVPPYTLMARRVGPGKGGADAWAWEYRGRYQDGAQSDWITEDEARDSFSPLQLDVFHALWELHHPSDATRPTGEPTRGEREVESRDRALEMFPRGTEVGRVFMDAEGRSKTFKAKVYDYCDPYWRVEYPDGDWEALTKSWGSVSKVESAGDHEEKTDITSRGPPPHVIIIERRFIGGWNKRFKIATFHTVSSHREPSSLGLNPSAV
ncbi:unnamed protein product [Ectocarpus sp. CCAP 1310/34]|nr:unnamed protein product [Ectocarpus sp. CCAP 1310/34]